MVPLGLVAPAAGRGVVPSPPSFPPSLSFLPSSFPSLPLQSTERPVETWERLQGCARHLGLATGVASNPLSCHFQGHVYLRLCRSPRFGGGTAGAPGAGPFPEPSWHMSPRHPMPPAIGSHCAKPTRVLLPSTQPNPGHRRARLSTTNRGHHSQGRHRDHHCTSAGIALGGQRSARDPTRTKQGGGHCGARQA